jgi:serine/threonine-protein kinase HipA
MDRRAATAGLSAGALGPLDRLAMVGARAMGALIYEPEADLEPPTVVSIPEIAADVKQVLADVDGPDLDRLLALGGSPQGARPKVLVQIADDGALVHGDRSHRPGFSPYIVKFRARGDDVHAGTLEHAYLRMAAAAGIDVPDTRMLGRTSRHPGYFAIRRFDRDGCRKVHMHTLAGLLHVPHLAGSITYRDLLPVTRQLTRDEGAVADMPPRLLQCLRHNRDDHAQLRLPDERTRRMHPSPAYDLTFHRPGGEHSLLIGREGKAPTRAHLLELATSIGLRRPEPIIDEVRAAVDRFLAHADAAGVPAKLRASVATTIGARPAPRPRTKRRK